MLETIITDVTGVFRSTFMSGDWIAMAIAFGSVLVGALAMRRGTQVGSMTLLALMVFAVGGYLRGYLQSADAEAGDSMVSADRAVNQLDGSWAQFMDMQAGSLLAYFIAFMALILVLFSVKAMLSRG